MRYLVILFAFFSGSLYGSAQTLCPSAAIRLSADMVLHLHVSPFDTTEHRIEYCNVPHASDSWSGVCLIDGRPVLGTDWDLPKTRLDEAFLVISGDTVHLDVSCMFNPWFGSVDSSSFSAEDVEGAIMIRGEFSDGAGSYEAKWLVIHGSSVRTELESREY